MECSDKNFAKKIRSSNKQKNLKINWYKVNITLVMRRRPTQQDLGP